MSRLVELRGKMRRSNRHAHTLTKSLPERTGGHFDAGGQSIFRVSRRLAVELPEVLDVFKREIVARQMQQGIQQHRTMSARKDETVASRPLGVARIVPQVTRPHCERHGCRTHRKPRMTGVGFLNCIRGKEADGIDRTSLKISCCHYEFLRKRLSSILPNERQM